jgi:hypothetical protein
MASITVPEPSSTGTGDVKGDGRIATLILILANTARCPGADVPGKHPETRRTAVCPL